MTSPFPGMDPYLEGHLFPDVHNSLAYLISVQLSQQVGANYLVHTNNYTIEDNAPSLDVGIMYPDVEVFQKTVDMAEEPSITSDKPKPFSPETLILDAIKPIEVIIPVVEIHDRKHNRLVTAIEILSPVNKRQPGIEPYRAKQKRMFEGGVNLIEIDLLRRGERPIADPRLPKTGYLVTLRRAGTPRTHVWAMSVKEALPIVPVPLIPPDDEIALDLGKALAELYAQRMLHKSIDYSEAPPPPAFTAEEMAWMAERIAEWKNI